MSKGTIITVCDHSITNVFGGEWYADEDSGETMVLCDACVLALEHGEELELYEVTIGAPEGEPTH